MGFTKICTLDDIWEGDMESYEVDGHEILVIVLDGGKVIATQAVCPHQNSELVEGKLEGKILTCRMHEWQFDVETGKGVNPENAAIAQYPVKVDGDDILVDLAGAQPLFCEP